MAEFFERVAKNVIFGAIAAAVAMIGLATTAEANPIVLFDTSLGSFEVELFPDAAPQTVQNFLNIVNSGAYDNTFFHRTTDVTTDGIGIVQGGGYSVNSTPITPSTVTEDIPVIPNFGTIPLEYNLPNSLGTIAMARQPGDDTAGSQFFFNVTDNSTALGPSANSDGYAVFGQVLGNGLSVLQAIDATPTLTDITGYTGTIGPDSPDPSDLLGPIPLVNFSPNTPQITADNLIIINSVTVVPEPSTIALASLGGLACAMFARRRVARC